MKASEVKVGGVYWAKVSGRLAPVRIVGLGARQVGCGSRARWVTVYDCVNTSTGRAVTVRSPQRFRSAYAVQPAAGTHDPDSCECALCAAIRSLPAG
jgi:hypothetical protein